MEIKLLSVIVPIYKQEKTIVEDLGRIYSTLKSTPYNFEIIGVVDGSSLDNSLKNAKSYKKPEIQIYGIPINKGKGQAVRYGMQKAKGDVVTFIDSGMDINPNGIMMLLEHMKWYSADIILGSKLHPASIVKHYTTKRKILTYGYYIFTRLLFGLKIKDTQTGLKAFKKKVLDDVLEKLVIKKFAFDIEILAVAKRSGHTKIYSAPVEVNWSAKNAHTEFFSSKLFKTVTEFVIDTLAVWYRLNILKYYDDGRLREKIYDKDLDLYINTGNMKNQKKQRIIDIANRLFSRV